MSPGYNRPLYLLPLNDTNTTTSELDRLKAAAANVAAAMVEDGLIVGLGSGSTASLAVSILGHRGGGLADHRHSHITADGARGASPGDPAVHISGA